VSHLTTYQNVVFLIDVDNTLLDSDRILVDFRRHLEKELGRERQQRYWELFKELRDELGHADYLGALQRYRIEYPHDSHVLTVSWFLLNYPFEARLFPNALDVVNRIRQRAQTVLVSDGDSVFQSHKIHRAGLFHAVDNHVLIYSHKEQELADIEARYPADHYVLIDDKLQILSSVKSRWRSRVTTVFLQQGHYAWAVNMRNTRLRADHRFERIGDLLQEDLAGLLTPVSCGSDQIGAPLTYAR
jgi:hypothetical protein